MGSNQKQELGVFKAFAKVCPMVIEAGSISAEDPPQPDIRCSTQAGETLHFELVEVVDQDFKKAYEDDSDIFSRLICLAEDLPADMRADLKGRLGNACVIVHPRSGASMRLQREACAPLVTWLIRIDSGFEGSLEIPKSDPPGKGFQSLEVIRGSPDDGPWFLTPSFGSVSDPTKQLLEKKFGKPYRQDGPMELLAHYQFPPRLRLPVFRADLEGFLAQRLPQSGFRRVWFFNQSREEIDLVSPMLQFKTGATSSGISPAPSPGP